jgi:hypothetical protein
MRKIVVTLSAAAALLAAGSIAQRAEAVPLGNPSGIAAAQEDVGTIDKVHCVPGWRHHYPTNWRRGDGCRRYGGAYYYDYGPSVHFRSFGLHRGHRHGIHRGHRGHR